MKSGLNANIRCTAMLPRETAILLFREKGAVSGATSLQSSITDAGSKSETEKKRKQIHYKRKRKKNVFEFLFFFLVNGPLPSFLSAVEAVLSCALTSGMGCTIGHGSQGQQVTWRSAVYKCICFKWFHS